MKWRMPTQCENCPFHKTGPGAALRNSLVPGRIREIKRQLRGGAVFWCHKTTKLDEIDDDTDFAYPGGDSALVCAGALAYQAQCGVSSNYQRVCERIEALKEH